MSVQTNGGAGQAPTAGVQQPGQAPAAQGDQQGAQGQQRSTEGQAPNGQQQTQQFDPSTIQDPALRAWAEKQAAELERARQEAARFRTERSTLATQVQEFQRQSETAEQAAAREAREHQERLERLEQENRTLKVSQEVSKAAADAHNPALVASMISPQVVLDDQGKPTNVGDLIAALKASDPYLFKITPASADAGAGRSAGSHSGAPATTGEAVNALLRSGGRGIPIR